MYCSSYGGPLVVIDGDFDKVDEEFTVSVLGRFTQGKNAETVTMVFKYSTQMEQVKKSLSNLCQQKRSNRSGIYNMKELDLERLLYPNYACY